MADWKFELNFSDFWDKYPKELSVKECSKKVSERIFALIDKINPESELDIAATYYLDDLYEIAENFKYVEDKEDFNRLLDELYDWGDILLEKKNFHNDVKMCWIKTSF